MSDSTDETESSIISAISLYDKSSYLFSVKAVFWFLGNASIAWFKMLARSLASSSAAGVSSSCVALFICCFFCRRGIIE